MVDRHVLSSRLSALEGYLAELEAFQDFSAEDFVETPAAHHLAERFLHLACECVLDTAHHLISDLGLRQPAGYRDAMDVLAEEGILEADLAERLKGWMGFRNVLVHFYMDIDHGRTLEVIKEDLDDLRGFGAAMARFLDD